MRFHMLHNYSHNPKTLDTPAPELFHQIVTTEAATTQHLIFHNAKIK